MNPLGRRLERLERNGAPCPAVVVTEPEAQIWGSDPPTAMAGAMVVITRILRDPGDSVYA
jgi:hypothetical protein